VERIIRKLYINYKSERLGKLRVILISVSLHIGGFGSKLRTFSDEDQKTLMYRIGAKFLNSYNPWCNIFLKTLIVAKLSKRFSVLRNIKCSIPCSYETANEPYPDLIGHYAPPHFIVVKKNAV
jgi:hypothetical protein